MQQKRTRLLLLRIVSGSLSMFMCVKKASNDCDVSVMLAEEDKTEAPIGSTAGQKRGSSNQQGDGTLLSSRCLGTRECIVQYDCTRTGRSNKLKKSEVDPARKGKTAVCFLV